MYRHYGQYGGHAKALLQGFALERRLLNCINWLVITMKIAYAMKRKKSLLRYFCYLIGMPCAIPPYTFILVRYTKIICTIFVMLYVLQNAMLNDIITLLTYEEEI